MPWKECSVMDERLRFVVKLLDVSVPLGEPRLRHGSLLGRALEPAHARAAIALVKRLPISRGVRAFRPIARQSARERK